MPFGFNKSKIDPLLTPTLRRVDTVESLLALTAISEVGNAAAGDDGIGIQFRSDGRIRHTGPIAAFFIHAGEWYTLGNTSGIGANYELFAVLNSTNAIISGPSFNTWHALSSNLGFSISAAQIGTLFYNLTVTIRKTAFPSDNVTAEVIATWNNP